MTRAELLESMSLEELGLWSAYFKAEAEQIRKAAKSNTTKPTPARGQRPPRR